MKKLFAMLLVLVMVLSMAACATNVDGSSGTQSTPAGTQSTPAGTQSTPAGNQESTNGTESNDPPESTGGSGSASGIDMSQFPAEFADWSAEDVNNYFIAAGVFTNADWVYTQPHQDYYPGMAINDGCGYMDYDGLVMIMMFTFDVNSTEADVPAYMESVRANKALDEMMGFTPVDHMLGHVVFITSFTADEDVYNAMEAAIQQLAQDVGIALDF